MIHQTYGASMMQQPLTEHPSLAVFTFRCSSSRLIHSDYRFRLRRLYSHSSVWWRSPVFMNATGNQIQNYTPAQRTTQCGHTNDNEHQVSPVRGSPVRGRAAFTILAFSFVKRWFEKTPSAFNLLYSFTVVHFLTHSLLVMLTFLSLLKSES